MKAFFELNTCRQLGFGGVGPIPWRDMILYAEVVHLAYEVRLAFMEIIRVMDRAFMTWQAEQDERDKGRRGKGGASRVPFQRPSMTKRRR